MNKLNRVSKPSKLSSKAQQPYSSKNHAAPMGLSSPEKTNAKPTSVRLTADDKAILNYLVREINGVSKTKISESDTIRALIRFSENSPIESIFKAYKDGM